MLIQINKVVKKIGGLPLFEDVNLTVRSQDKIGIVGTNGTGKTTLFKILTDEEGIDSGTISKKKNLKIGYIKQQQRISNQDVLTYIMESYSEVNHLKNNLENLAQRMALETENLEKILNQYSKGQEAFEAAGGYVLEDNVLAMLRGLGIEDKATTLLQELSGGERVRVELAKVLAEDADILLLDEPTNHLDIAGIKWLENYLNSTKKSFLVIAHDRQFLDRTVQKVIEIEAGTFQEFQGNYTRYRELKAEQIKQLQKDVGLQQKEIARLKKLAKQYRQWGNESDNEKFFKKAKEIEKRLEKIQVIKPPVTVKQRLGRNVAETRKNGKEVLKVERVGKIVGDNLLFENRSFLIYRHERIALLGENGCGKSTLLKLLFGETLPDEGSITLGESVKIGYLPQKLHFEEPEKRVLDFGKALLGNEEKARSELAGFGFYASDVSKRIKDLSGGEQVRLSLMVLFQNQVNFLILDEPTNHLDLFAREELEEILQEYKGTLLVVSHDRYFLKKTLDKSLIIRHQQIEKREELLLENLD